jgi:hypothetical protein
MLPPTPMNDVPNRSTGDPEMGGQGLDQFALRTALSDGQDLLFGQLGRRVGIPTRDKFGMQSPEIPVAVAMPTLGNHVVGVVLSRPQEEVGRIDACSIVAMVQNPQATGDRAEVQSPRELMAFAVRTVGVELAVPAVVLATRPNPARTEVRHVCGYGTVLVDVRPEPFDGGEELTRSGAMDANPHVGWGDVEHLAATRTRHNEILGYTHGSLRGTDGRLEGAAGADTPVPPSYFTTKPHDFPVNIEDYRIAVGNREAC